MRKIDGIEKVFLTTNGTLFEENFDALFSSGIDGINISLNAHDEFLYEKITRKKLLEKALRALELALSIPGCTVKVNCVAMEWNKECLKDIAAFAQIQNVAVRFIELMPIGEGRSFSPVREKEVKRLLEKEYGDMYPSKGKMGNGPGRYYEIPGFIGKVGFISPISYPFCEKCNRIRLTSVGKLKTCLQTQEVLDLREMLHEKKSDEEIKNAITKEIEKKPIFREIIDDFVRIKTMNMSQIGG